MVSNMPTIYLNKEANEALESTVQAIKKKSGVKINLSMAVIFLHAAWKEAKR